ncbi:MAG: SDR family NAD(P)-dependent oxidoreductase [Bacillota bacterium]
MLEGKVALVTGASRGLGRAAALALAKAGADVALTDILLESQSDCGSLSGLNSICKENRIVYTESTAEEIRTLGRNALALRMDVTNRDDVKDVIARSISYFGKIDILVNNAAAMDHVAKFEDQNDSLWERDLNVNITGVYNCCKAVWPHMKRNGGGRIINISSIVGTIGGYGMLSYATTKAAVLGLTKTLALEGAKYNITVNAISPGVIMTEAVSMNSSSARERLIAQSAFRRPGSPEDVAGAIVYIASEQAGYITGINLKVSGGIELLTL